MSLDRQHKAAWVVLVVIAVVVVVAMVATLFYFSGYFRGDPEEPSPVATGSSKFPSDWPVSPTPEPTVEYEPGEGGFVDPGTVPVSDPDAVAEAFAELTVSWDTATDKYRAAGLERARALAAPELETTMPTVTQNAEWSTAAEHLAYTVPDAEVLPMAYDGPPPTSPTTGEPVTPYTVDVSYVWQGRDGWVSDAPSTRTVYLSLVERDGVWSVVEYGYQDPVTVPGPPVV